MYTIKTPEAEIRRLYPTLLQLGMALSLFIISMTFVLSKKIESDVVVQSAPETVLETEEIPITKQVKRPPPPARPTIPVEDPEVDIEDDMAFQDLDDIDWSAEPPPPPPPAEDEVVDFFAVEVQPKLIGGEKALMDYLNKNNLYPEMARTAKISGVAIIRFVVGADGKATDVEVFQEKPVGVGFGPAGVKAIQAMKFSPGIQRDKKVAVRMQQVIRFQIQ
ncbi:energy transducer TonB [bacterium]|nr:energy transducer TonB [bacterium]